MKDSIVLLAYASLVVDLVVYPVRSVASTLAVMKRSVTRADGTVAPSLTLAVLPKLALFALPTALCVVFFLLPIAMIVDPRLRSAFGPIRAPEPEAVAWTGVLLVVLGGLLTFSSVLTMRGGDARPFRPVRPSELRRHRLFSRSRNPGLLGMFAFYLGLVLVYPCWILLAGIPLYFGNMHWRVLLEESDLGAKFGSDYRAYRERTRRYL